MVNILGHPEADRLNPSGKHLTNKSRVEIGGNLTFPTSPLSAPGSPRIVCELKGEHLSTGIRKGGKI